MNDHTARLRDLQKQIRELDQQRSELHQERAQAILQAKSAGMNNRTVAKVLGVHEQAIYRLQSKGETR